MNMNNFKMNLNCPITFVVAVDAKNSNPNGDPDNDNIPRRHDRGIGYFTQECIKRKVRDYIIRCVENEELPALGNLIYCSNEQTIENFILGLLKELGFDKKEVEKDKELQKQAYLALCKATYDLRMFGGVLTTFSKTDFLHCVKGAIQIDSAESFDPVVVMCDGLTRCCRASDKDKSNESKETKENETDEETKKAEDVSSKNTTMGRKYYVEYGLYRYFAQYNPYLGKKNGVTEEDIQNLVNAFIYWPEEDMSSARGLITTREVIGVFHNNPHGSVRRSDILDALTATKKPGVTEPHDFSDYDLVFHRENLPKDVVVVKYTMEHPEGVVIE